jgi:small subunit ribosomal protein S16
MALTIRMRQQGQKNRRMFRLVVADSRSPRDGKFIETLGHYNPFDDGGEGSTVKEDRVEYWVKNGAQMSVNAQHFLKRKCPELSILKAK